jgi:hypothetical protein
VRGVAVLGREADEDRGGHRLHDKGARWGDSIDIW